MVRSPEVGLSFVWSMVLGLMVLLLLMVLPYFLAGMFSPETAHDGSPGVGLVTIMCGLLSLFPKSNLLLAGYAPPDPAPLL